MTTTLAPAPLADDRPIWDIWLSSLWLPAVLAADALGVFAALDDEPADAAGLADRLALDGEALVSLLALLSGLGLARVRHGRFELTAPGRLYLRRGEPLYWGEALGVMGHSPVVELLCQSLRGAAPKGHYQAARQWGEGQAAEEAAAAVARVMQSQSLPSALGLAALDAFEGVKRLLDVAGGSGCFAVALAQRHPDMRCTVMELPAMGPIVAGHVARAGLCHRVEVVEADMFADAWPGGYDAVLFSNVFHDWDASANSLLAAKAFDALVPKGRVMLHEMLLADQRDGPLPAAAFSMMMLLAVGGRQYAARELAAMLAEAGFGDAVVRPAFGHYSLVSAVRP